MKEVKIHIRDKKIVNMHEMRDVFNKLSDGQFLISIKNISKRSIQQNRYYWSVVVPAVRKGLYEAGYDEVKTNNDAHEVIKHIHLRKRIVSKQTGDVIDIAGSSTELSTPAFNDFIESICRWSAEFLGVVIPSPNEYVSKDFENWIEEIENEIEA